MFQLVSIFLNSSLGVLHESHLLGFRIPSAGRWKQPSAGIKKKKEQICGLNFSVASASWMLKLLKTRVMVSDCFWPEVAEEMLFQARLLKGEWEQWCMSRGGPVWPLEQWYLGEGSVLHRPHWARALRPGAVRGLILRKHNAELCWIQSQ